MFLNIFRRLEFDLLQHNCRLVIGGNDLNINLYERALCDAISSVEALICCRDSDVLTVLRRLRVVMQNLAVWAKKCAQFNLIKQHFDRILYICAVCRESLPRSIEGISNVIKVEIGSRVQTQCASERSHLDIHLRTLLPNFTLLVQIFIPNGYIWNAYFRLCILITEELPKIALQWWSWFFCGWWFIAFQRDLCWRAYYGRIVNVDNVYQLAKLSNMKPRSFDHPSGGVKFIRWIVVQDPQVHNLPRKKRI
mmetsp:Transcript_28962/g.59334  ORF Transcript_28962/g.59334 Transcript_28962/m.59334 type:complete len:251 (-) Transcript_28962:1197-1949(-)